MTSLSLLRKRFPQIEVMDKNKECYLDSASTTLKLDLAIKTLSDFYNNSVANVHRGEHGLSLEATNRYEKARQKVAQFLNASSPDEIIFTRGTTEGINLLSFSLKESLKKGDEIIVSEMEHHSNFLPWQNLAKRKDLKLKVIKVTKKGELDLSHFESLLSEKTKILALSHVSNVTGGINPLKEIIKRAKKKEALIVIDAAQSASFLNLDVKDLDVDFLVFSGHKVFSPSGIGVLYGKKDLLDKTSSLAKRRRNYLQSESQRDRLCKHSSKI